MMNYLEIEYSNGNRNKSKTASHALLMWFMDAKQISKFNFDSSSVQFLNEVFSLLKDKYSSVDVFRLKPNRQKCSLNFLKERHEEQCLNILFFLLNKREIVDIFLTYQDFKISCDWESINKRCYELISKFDLNEKEKCELDIVEKLIDSFLRFNRNLKNDDYLNPRKLFLLHQMQKALTPERIDFLSKNYPTPQQFFE